MRSAAILLMAIIMAPQTVAVADDARATIAILNKAASAQIDWKLAKARAADVTCDGRADTIIFGTGEQSVWVGVVSGKDKHAQIFQFPAAGNSEDAFAGPPLGIRIYPRTCEGGEGDRLPGCRRIARCKEFSVENEADAFHFYWDGQHRILRWWRL